MASYQTLEKLIHKLNKAEKREFTKFIGSNVNTNAYCYVFYHIQKHKKGFEKLKKDFLKVFPKSSLSTAMNHLYYNLLDFLVVQEKNADLENKIVHSILQIKVLYARGLYDECFQLTIKMRELCRKSEFHDWFYMLSKLELMLRMSTRYFNLGEAELVHLHGEVQKMLNYLQTQWRHQFQYDLLRIRRAGSRSAAEINPGYALDDLAIHEQQIFANPRYSSMEAEKLHLMFQSEYFLARGNLSACQRIFQTLDRHFQQNPQLIQNSGLHYLTHIAGMLQAVYQSGKYDNMGTYLERLDQWGSENPTTVILSSCLSFHYKILKYLKLKKVDDALKNAKEAEIILMNTMAPYTFEASRLLRLSVGITYFAYGDFRKSDHHLSDCYSRDNISINLNAVMYTARLMKVFIHFAKENFDVMEAEIRSFERSLRKLGQLTKKQINLHKLLINYYSGQTDFIKNLEMIVNETPQKEDLMHQSLVFYDWLEWFSIRIKTHSVFAQN